MNIDKLSYASSKDSLADLVIKNNNYEFVQADICNKDIISKVFKDFKPNIIMHLAAESHVDRSIESPDVFMQSNIIGTYTLLEESRKFFDSLEPYQKKEFRFLHISTDEVYGSLGSDGLFDEKTPYDPSSPYSASKASSDHLVRAWHRTYNLPTIVTNCSNNYGPFQFPEKIIPLMIDNALNHKKLPIYGDGQQIRDWLFVDDHVSALVKVALRGKVGDTYNIGGRNEKSNIEVVQLICKTLDELSPSKNIKSYSELISFVKDRPGHDKRYAINADKIKKDLDWTPIETFETGLLKTIQWYLNNRT